MNKKCANCGSVVNTLDEQQKQEFLVNFGRPKKQGASQNYFDLWKRVYDFCPQCYYTANDLSDISTSAKDFMQGENCKKLKENKIFDYLSEFRPNNILFYVIAGYVFEQEGNYIEACRAFANASDDFYGEIIYWESEVEVNGELQINDKELSAKFHIFAEKLYDKSIEMLKKYIDLKPDTNAKILYAGLLSGGNQKQKEYSKEYIKNLLLENLSNEQIDMLNFIQKTTY